MNYLLCVLMLVLLMGCTSSETPEKTARPKYVLVIHGGAGKIEKEKMPEEWQQAYRDALQSALNTGQEMLAHGGTAIDAVEATIHLLEDNLLFNAGKGAVFTNEGHVELDASFMDGKTRNAGAIAGVRTVRHPISAARMVMDSSVHVMLSGEGADAFANSMGLEIVDNSYFHTERRKNSLRKIQKQEGRTALSESEFDEFRNSKYGTVGCVALDQSGNLAAGTSTGGMSNKRYGRIGDSPIIGAGTYANNATCAVSCTGHGEYFIRNVIAYDVSALMEYSGLNLEAATDTVIHQKLTQLGGTGGLIAVDRHGNIAMPFNTSGMFRAFVKSDGSSEVRMFQDEPDN